MSSSSRHEAGPVAVLVDFQQTPLRNTSLTHCDAGGCTSRARWSTNLGFRCAGCARRAARRAERNRTLYGVGFLQPAELLAAGLDFNSSCGVIIARPSRNETCSRLHYHPFPERAVLELDGLPDVNRQAQAVARTLWGLGLAIGADLVYWNRDAGYPPEEIEPYLELIRWVMGSRYRLGWLLTYAGCLMDAHTSWPRKNGKAGGARHKSLDGAVAWWLGALKLPELRRRIPVTPTDGDDWPPTARNHPAVLAARNSRQHAA